MQNVSTYRFEASGDLTSGAAPAVDGRADGREPGRHRDPIGQRRSPTDEPGRARELDPLRSARRIAKSPKYTTTYWEKLAQPFACFVFVLIGGAVRPAHITRGGGNTSLGFGLAVAIVFVYYVAATVFSYVGEALVWMAFLWAWMPNIIFTAIGASRLRKAAAV